MGERDALKRQTQQGNTARELTLLHGSLAVIVDDDNKLVAEILAALQVLDVLRDDGAGRRRRRRRG